jgi:single-strand DNA-binding protein
MHQELNKTVISGRLTKDPEVKNFNGNKICRLSIACLNEFYSNKSKSIGKEICYVDINLWGNGVDAAQNAQKGDHVAIEGRLRLNTWNDNEGKKKSRHFIHADKFINLSKTQPEKTTNKAHESSSSHIASLSATRSAQPQNDSQMFDEDLPF